MLRKKIFSCVTLIIAFLSNCSIVLADATLEMMDPNYAAKRRLSSIIHLSITGIIIVIIVIVTIFIIRKFFKKKEENENKDKME